MANRPGLLAALESTTGTVTNFLEQLVGESIEAQTHHFDIVGAPTSNDLEVEQGEPLLRRAATLRGGTSGSPYVYAESVIVSGRLPTRFCLRLQSSTDPIGRIIDEMAIAVTRVNLVEPQRLFPSRPDGATKIGDYLLARTYRIDSDTCPLMVITEWFLKTLKPFLSPL